MSILRNGSPERPFTQICNSCLRDKNLKPGPFAVLMFCLSLPRDWTVNLEYMARHRGMHVDTVQTAINKLVALGYCRRSQGRSSGKFSTYEYDFTDVPHTFAESLAVAGSDLPPPDRKKPGAVYRTGNSPARGFSGAYKERTNQQTKTQAKNKPLQPKAKGPIDVCSDDLVGKREQAPTAEQDADWVEALDAEGEAKLAAEAAAHAAEARARDVVANRVAEIAAATEALAVEQPPEAALLATIPDKQLAKLKAWGLNPAELVDELAGEIRRRKISNPVGYLVGMARRRVAARDGIPETMVEATYSSNPTIRATAYAVALGSTQPERWKGARHRAAGGSIHLGSHLMAALEGRRVGA